MKHNEYTDRWFATFMDTLPQEWTEAEVTAIARRLPLPQFRLVLDVCCGTGRHAAHMASLGYAVTAIDRDGASLERARADAPSGRFFELDQRDLDRIRGPFDAAMILWQSFGYFDPETNDRILAALARLIRPEGRLLLDLFHPGYFRRHAGRITDVRSPHCAAITNEMDGDRLTSTIEYRDGTIETMNFELFEPDDLVERARPFGFHVVEACCWWDDSRDPNPDVQRYQMVFERG